MVALLAAAASALIWGVGDFSGGKASQRANPLVVAIIVELLGLPVLAVLLLIRGGVAAPADLAWGAVAGVAGFAGLAIFYRGLAGGAMAVVAPVTAVTSAVVPLTFGLLTERAPAPAALAGAVLAVVAIGLVSVTRPDGTEHRVRVGAGALGSALLAGALFGAYFTVLGQASASAAEWPLVASRLTGAALGVLAVAGTVVVARSRSWRGARPVTALGRTSLRWALVAGPFDVIGNALYLVAVHEGALSVVAPIASLYPASTVLLALLVDGERLRPVQIAGLGLAAGALALSAHG